MRKDLYKPAGDYASAPVSNKTKYGMLVNGSRHFTMSRWREAILMFLFSIWSGEAGSHYIYFGTVKLELSHDGQYFTATGMTVDEPDLSHYNQRLDVGTERLEVMDALVRLAKDDRVGKVSITLPGNAMLQIWERERRGEYGVSFVRFRR